ncbi:MAG: hypothetical protein FWG11_01810 [Promicromonosporaceae bacterium]|nr:hypothetical protein [Promicromonosporaceae bacterium]
MTQPRVALVTCREIPDLTPDDLPLLEAIAALGVTADAVVWDDPQVDWAAYRLVVIRSTWDYVQRRDEFLAWARSVPNLVNAARTVEWNTDKQYLRDLEASGVPVIPTVWLDPERHFSKRAVHTRMPAYGDFVVKPTISARAKEAGRYQPVDVGSRMKAIQHVMRLLDSGRPVMIQPYIQSVDQEGETSLVFIGGEFQHAVKKKALLNGPGAPTVGLALYRPHDVMSAVTVGAAGLAVAEQALAAAAEHLGVEASDFLYARVDLLQGDSGPLVIELELTEPALWLRYSGDHPTTERFAAAIVARAGQASREG